MQEFDSQVDSEIACLGAFETLGFLVEDLLETAKQADQHGVGSVTKKALTEAAANLLDRCYATQDEVEANRTLTALEGEIVIPDISYLSEPFAANRSTSQSGSG